MKAMHQGSDKLCGKVDVDESGIGGKETSKRGRSKGKKREFVIGVQMLKTKIVRVYAQQIKNASTREVQPFFQHYIDKEAQVRVDEWRAYNPIKNDYPFMIQQKSNLLHNFKLLHREIMMLKESVAKSVSV